MTYNPSNEGLLNLLRAQRWCWNFNTFLSNQNTNVWSEHPVCLTFKQADLAYLLDDRVDPQTNEVIPSAGFRLYLGLHQNPHNKFFLQLFALRAEEDDLFQGNQEAVYNDVYNIPNYNAHIYGYDLGTSSSSRPASVFNPAVFPNNTGNGIQYILGGQEDYPNDPETSNIANQNHVHNAITEYYNAIQGNGNIQSMPPSATTVVDHNQSPALSYPFQVTPALWPWAFFFDKGFLVNEFGDPNTAHLDRDLRVYFGITDQFDSNETGATPGILKLFIIGVDPNDNGDDIDPQHQGNHILDFSLPCPQYCGQFNHRFWTPPAQ